METILEPVNLMIGGILISPVVVLVVQILKWVMFLKDGNQARIAVIVVAAILNAVWLSTQITTGMEYSAIVDVSFMAFVSVIFAVIEYWAAENMTTEIKQRIDGSPRGK